MAVSRQLILTYLYLFIYILLSSGVILYNNVWQHFLLVYIVAFIRMLKALMPVATFIMAILCGTDKLRCDVFLNLLVVNIGVIISSYGEIHFNVIGTLFQVTVIVAEALRLVLTQILLQKKGLTLNPITSLYCIAPCSFFFLFVPWYLIEMSVIEVAHIKYNFWIFLSHAVCALALNFSIFLVIGWTGVVTVRVAGVLKDWILIALSTVVFPDSTITGLNIIGYTIALCGVIMYNYIKVKDGNAVEKSADTLPERFTRNLIQERKSDNDKGSNGGTTVSERVVDEEAPLVLSSRFYNTGRSHPSRSAWPELSTYASFISYLFRPRKRGHYLWIPPTESTW